MTEAASISPKPTVGVQPGRVWMLALAVSAVLYLATAAPGVLWGDSGETQLYVLLGDWLVDGQICRSHVPYFALTRGLAALWRVPAARTANLTAALFGALTVANAALVMAQVCRSRWATISGALLLMLSHTLWQLSTSAEVLSLSTALMTAEWLAIFQWIRTRHGRWAFAAGWLNGLGVATHNLALLAWPAYVVLMVRHRRRLLERPARTLALGLGGGLIGAAPLLALGWSVLAESGSLAETIESWLIGRYAPRVFNLSDLPQLALQSLGYAALNFPTPLLLLSLPGWLALRARVSGGAWTFITVHAAALVLFLVRYNVADQYTFFVHLHVWIALACAGGVDGLIVAARDARAGARRSAAAVALSVLAPLCYAAVPPVLRTTWPSCPLLPQRVVPHRDPFNWFLRPWRTGYDGPQRFVRELFTAVPEDVLLYADSQFVGPIIYKQRTEGARRDIRLDPPKPAQDWLPAAPDVEALRQASLSAGKMFVCSPEPRYLPPWLRGAGLGFRACGPVWQAVASGTEK